MKPITQPALSMAHPRARGTLSTIISNVRVQTDNDVAKTTANTTRLTGLKVSTRISLGGL